MTLEASILELRNAVGAVTAATERLRLGACEDSPGGGRTIFVDEVCNWALEVFSAAQAMKDELASAGASPDRASAEMVVAKVAGHAVQVEDLILQRAVDPEHAVSMARHSVRPRGWAGWVDVTTGAIRGCAAPLAELRMALLRCWSELVQRPDIRVDKATVSHLNLAGVTAMGAKQET